MATIRFEDQDAETPDNGPILKVCEELGIPFGCQDGVCGTCIVYILEGMENLGERNEKETDMDLDDGQRLACQCVIKSGLVDVSLD